MSRFEVQPFTPELIRDAARLLARRHAGHRQATPALDPAFEQPAAAERLVSDLAARDHASGAVALKGDEAIAYVLGARRSDTTWGPNVWMEDAGSAGDDAEAIREAYALAAARWHDEGRTSHFVVVPANDEVAVKACSASASGSSTFTRYGSRRHAPSRPRRLMAC
jgi:hypothetical protein